MHSHIHIYPELDPFLFIIPVPPERPVILEADRKERLSNVAAYNEGSDVILICEVNGGKYLTIILVYELIREALNKAIFY